MPTWPATLPQKPLAGKWSWSQQRNKVSFQPEIGPTIDRRRGSSSNRAYQGTFDFTSAAMIATFETWFNDDLLDGTLPFDWADPINGATYSWKFSANEQPYQIVANGNNYHEMSCSLIRL